MLFLLFQLGDQRYAIAAAAVHEVLPVVAIRPIAHAVEGVAGVATHRGAPLPVIDLARLLLSRDAEIRRSTRLVVVAAGAGREPRRLGLIAERVTEVARLAPADFQPCGVSSARAPYLGDMARVNDGLVQQVDVERLLPASVREALFQDLSGHHDPR